MNNNLEAMIKEVVKEALREVLAETGVTVPKTVSEKKAVSEEVVEVIKEEVKESKSGSVTGSKDVKKGSATGGKVTKKAEPVEEPVNEVEDGQTPDPTATVANERKAELEAMSFKDLQNIIKELGGKAVGGKAVLIQRILDAENISEQEEAEINELEVEEVTNSHENDVVEEVDEEGEEDAEPTLYDKVVAETEDMSDEELADLLSEVGISPKGKRQALLTKIVQGIEDGKIDWDDDSEEDSAEEATEADTEEAEENGAVENSPERQEAMDELEENLRTAYKDKELTDKEIVEFLSEYHNDPKYKGTKVENLNEYITIMTSLIDEDGEEHEFQEAYYVGDDAHCCGAKLKELEDGNMYCEVCGTTYEV